MTCIAVKIEKDFIHLCADSEVTMSDWDKSSNIFLWDIVKWYSKIENIWDIYFGISWTCKEHLRFKQYVKTNNPKGDRLDDIEDYILWFYKECKEKDSDYKPCFYVILVYKKKVFSIIDHMIYEVENFDAKGSWMYYAITAMHLGKTAYEAIEVAKEFAQGVGGDIVEYKIKKK